jgi:hypothetical protein
MVNYESENDISGFVARKNTITSLDEDGGLVGKKKKEMSFGSQFLPEKY